MKTKVIDGGDYQSIEGVWRDGNLMVMQKGAQLPDRCIKTNQPANGKRFRATLYWHHPAIYFLIISPLLYAIVAICVNKKAIVYLGVTEEILQKRRRSILWGWVFGISGIILFFSVGLFPESVGAMIVLISPILMLGGLIGGSTGSTLARADRIGEEYIWIRGISKNYLDILPIFAPNRKDGEWNF